MTRYVYWGLGLVLIILTGLSLSGCLFQKPTPDEVVRKFTQAMAGVTTFHYDLALDLQGSLPVALAKDVSSVSMKLTGDAINQDPNQPQFTLQANITGVSAQGALAINGEVVNLSDYIYFRLTDLSLPTLLPVSLGADSRWYKIRHLSPANPSEEKLGVADNQQFTLEQMEALRKLVSQTAIAEVVEVLPESTTNGQRSYHYKVKLQPDAISQLIGQLNQLLNIKLIAPTPAMIAKYQPEIWINKRTFLLSQLKLADLYLLNSVPVAFDLVLGLSRQNDQLKISVPRDTEELNIERLLQERLPF